jgi:dTDP-4-dehydrorhamnose 3,5-epimerase
MGNFVFTETELAGVYIVECTRHGDKRGCFIENYNKAEFDAAGLCYEFVQDNMSVSQKGVLRGLHFQKRFPQAKLVRVLKGEVFDVAVDLRKGSATYGKWIGRVLSEDNLLEMLIPRGFAHGFYVLSDTAEFSYKCDEFYHPEDEGGIIWNDPDIAIAWPEAAERIMNERDRNYPTLAQCRFAYEL